MSTGGPTELPETCAVAFKEWSGVCAALERGEQSVILRKGGIAEGPGGFVPEHPVFWLYPTHVHQGEQGLRVRTETDEPPSGSRVRLGSLARVELSGRVETADLLPALEEFHVWTPETVAKRFAYRTPGLWVLAVRVFRREPAWELDVTPAHAGCKTWVPLEAPLETQGATAAVDPTEFSRTLKRLTAVLGRA